MLPLSVCKYMVHQELLKDMPSWLQNICSGKFGIYGSAEKISLYLSAGGYALCDIGGLQQLHFKPIQVNLCAFS